MKKYQDMTMSEIIARFEHGREVYTNVLLKVTRERSAPTKVAWLGHGKPLALGMTDGNYTNHGHYISPLFLSNDEGAIAAQARTDAHAMMVNNATLDYQAAQRNYTMHHTRVSDAQQALNRAQKSLNYAEATMNRADIAYQQARIRSMKSKRRRMMNNSVYTSSMDLYIDQAKKKIEQLRENL